MSENIPSKRSHLRPELDHFAKEKISGFSFEKKEEMPDIVVRNVIEQHPILKQASYSAMQKLAAECVDEIERLHNVTDIIKDPPEDIDAVWVISAPGLLLEHGAKPGWSSHFPWMNNLEWEVVGSSFALIISVTAKRLGRNVKQVSREDVLKYGPWLVYSAQEYETEPLRVILQESNGIPIPRDKTLIYEQFVDSDGSTQTIKNTTDQAYSLKMPDNVRPRKLAICVLAAQMVRLGRLLAKAKTIPHSSKVLIVPTPSPAGHEREHAIMECQGAVINVFKNGNAEKRPIDYKTEDIKCKITK